MLIDDSGARRITRGPVPAQSQDERDRFRAAVNKAQNERAKASDSDRFDSIRPQERLVVVERDDRLLEIAEEHHVDLDEIAAINPQLADVDYIQTGEVLFLPPASPTELAQRPDGVGLFRDELFERGNAIEYADQDVDHMAEIGALRADVVEFFDALPAADRETIAQQLFDEDWTDAGPAQMALEQAANELGITLAHSSHAGPATEYEIRNILQGISGEARPDQALAALDLAYSQASPEVKRGLSGSPEVREIIHEAAERAVSALSEKQSEAFGQSVEELEMARRVNDMTMILEPEMRSKFFQAFVPALEREYRSMAETGDPLMMGVEGTTQLFDAIGRLDPARDRSSIEGLAEIGIYHLNAIPPDLGQAGLLAYFTSLASQTTGNAGNHVLEMDILPRLEQNRREVESRIDDYQQHLMELNWLSQNGGSVMTEDQLNEAITAYTANDSNWADALEEKRARIAQDGERYLDQLHTLESYYPELFDPEGGELSDRLQQIEDQADREIAQRYAEQLDNPEATIAMRMAIEEKPSLLDDGMNMQLLGQYGKLTDRGRKLVEEVASLYIRTKVLPTMVDFKPQDAGSRAALLDELDALKRSNLPKILGVTPKSMDQAMDAIKATLPGPGADATRTGWIKQLETMDNKLGSVRGFQASSPGGQVLRMLGVAGAAAGFANSANNAANDLNIATFGKAFFDAAGLGQKGIELSSVYSQRVADSTLGKHLGSSRLPAVKALGAVTSAFDFYSAYQAGQNGDTAGAILYSTAGAGGITAALGTGTVLGPIGLIVSIGATAGLVVNDKIKQANQFETPVTASFLQHAGLSETAAKALADQSGDGYNVLPLLGRYAEQKGLDLGDPIDQATFASWLNDMPPDGLAALRDNIHRVLDQQGNDFEHFPASDAEGDKRFAELLNYSDPRYNTTRITQEGQGYPRSFVQIDMTLEVLGIQPLV
jgi:hypothetical protein